MAARRDLGPRQKLACAQFYFSAGGIRNLYATLTRSGSHWSLLGIAIARDLALGGKGEYDFKDDAWIPHAGAVYTKLDWREPAGDWDVVADPAVLSVVETKRMASEARSGAPVKPLLFHTHHPYFRLRSTRLKGMSIAVMLRPIFDSMESKYHKHRTLLGIGVRPTEYLENEGDPPGPENDYNFPWAKLIDDAIEFYNSWGEALEWHRSIRLFRYEDLIAAPADAHKELTDFWGLDLPRDRLEEAFRRISKDEMKKKLPTGNPDSTSRVAFRDRGAALTVEHIAFIRERMSRGLRYDLGYGLDWHLREAA